MGKKVKTAVIGVGNMGSKYAYLSSWERRMAELPKAGSREEIEFEVLFEKWLKKKCEG